MNHRAYRGEVPLRVICGENFVIMNDTLEEEFDRFRKHTLDLDLYVHAVEAIELVKHWYNSNATNLKTISKHDKTYVLMSSANIDTFCQWILDTRKLCNEKGVTLDSLTITSELKFIS
jgi:hypothetical protein